MGQHRVCHTHQGRVPTKLTDMTTSMVIITDFLIFLLPIPIVFPLKLPHRQKAALTAIFAVGFL